MYDTFMTPLEIYRNKNYLNWNINTSFNVELTLKTIYNAHFNIFSHNNYVFKEKAYT